MDKRIESMNLLKKQVKALKIKAPEKIDVMGDPKEGRFYTTKHYYYGMHVKKIW